MYLLRGNHKFIELKAHSSLHCFNSAIAVDSADVEYLPDVSPANAVNYLSKHQGKEHECLLSSTCFSAFLC